MNDYQLAKSVVSKLNIGDVETVQPADIKDFRRYLTIVSQKQNMKFLTKRGENSSYLVARVKKENIW